MDSAMSDLTVNPFITLPAATTTSDHTTSSDGLTGTGAGFQQMLTALLMSSTMSTSGSDSSTGGDLLSPVLFTLIEQMLAQQMNNLQAANPALTDQAANAATNTMGSGNLPVHGVVTQKFNSGHSGIDLAVKVGTPVHTSMEGKVVYAGWNNQGYGNLVVVENGAFRTYYAHLSQIPVTLGQTVHTGEVIGLSGNTGNSTGPHLHYEVRVNGEPVNPAGSNIAQRS